MTLAIVVESDANRGVGIQGYMRRLDGLHKAAGDMRPVFEEVHKQFLATERGIFASGGPGKAKWAPLTPKYLARKTRQGYDPRIMRRTGELGRALMTGMGPGAVTEIERTAATFGTNLAKAVFAHRGSGRMRRRLITIDRRRRNRWVGTVRDRLWEGAQHP